MGRLKKEHNGWKTSGLWLKYSPADPPQAPVRVSSKKNTKLYCKGKKGVLHTLERYFWHYGWDSRRSNLIHTRCTNCGKQFYGVHKDVPLRIEIDVYDAGFTPIQVKANRKAVPIDYKKFQNGYICELCGEWHFS